ncbi:chorismate mutase AroQ, gamma subclass [Candidatus Aerophobetes bacterium]|uniref:chorismate mutase n=1 Tax=Aerophobetes bacterium TaxID=2030807 RepID=A0A2A4YL05_UNCAE|nr:MAG: chorismate mutase AroQ, gamma subclass [Candidatus Aerophobetes bacterium]
MKHLFKKKRLLALCIVPLLAAAPILADSAKEAPKQEIVVDSKKKVEELSQLMAKRLDLFKKLAAYKWNNKIPIDEPKKEEAFLIAIEEKAEEKGVDPKIARAFFQSQLEAAKSIKIKAFEKWVKEDIHMHKEVVNIDETNSLIEECDNELLDAMEEKSQDLKDQKRKDHLRVMISKALKESQFPRDCIDSATNF